MISVGFIGLGLIGERRFRIVRDSGYPIVFAVDPDPKRHHALQTGDCRFAASLDQLDEKTVGSAKALFIAVPHHLAAGYSRWGIERKMHVLCEKPMGIASTEAEGLRALAAQAGVHFCAGFNYRFLPGVTALREIVQSGKLGVIHRIRMAMGHGGRPGMETEWKLQKAKAGGGALIDPGIHLVDLIRNLFGEPVVVSSRLRRMFWQTDVEDDCFVVFRVGDADVVIEVSLTNWKNRFSIEVYGSDAQVILSGRGGNYGSQKIEFVNRWFWKDDQRFEKDYGAADPSFDAETKAFLESAESSLSHPLLSNADDGCAALKIVEDIYSKSSR